MEGALLGWWLALCAAAAVNILLWTWSARRLAPDAPASRRWILWLSAVYVLGCAFRSVFPMVDLPRICLHDTWVSRVVVGRTVATVAELCFAYQWAILLREAGPGERIASFVARLIVPVVVLAELSCWAAVLTSNYLFHAVENSLWTLDAALALAAFLSLRTRADATTVRFIDAACVSALIYIAYMAIEDVPMYVSRWQAAGFTVPLDEGLRTLLERCVVRREWASWREDATWLTLYFSVAVWISIMLPHAPRLRISK